MRIYSLGASSDYTSSHIWQPGERDNLWFFFNMCDCSESLSFHLISRALLIKKKSYSYFWTKIKKPEGPINHTMGIPHRQLKSPYFFFSLEQQNCSLRFVLPWRKCTDKKNSYFGLSQQIHILSYKLNMTPGAMAMTKTKWLWSCFPLKGVFANLKAHLDTF